MAKCTRKLIDAEAAVSVAMAALVDTFIERKWTDADDYRFKAIVAMARALDALPDASEQAIHVERIPVPPHLAEAQRVVIRQAQQAGDGAEEE